MYNHVEHIHVEREIKETGTATSYAETDADAETSRDSNKQTDTQTDRCKNRQTDSDKMTKV